MTDDQARTYAEHLRALAGHFAVHDWDYTRRLGDLAEIRYARPEDKFLARLRDAWRWLTRKPAEWEKAFDVSRWDMARHALRRDKHLPDGILDSGNIIVHWEETGEYLQYVQPSVGLLLADLIDAHPYLPEVRAVVDEMARLNEAYGQRIKTGETGAPEEHRDE